MLAHKDDDTVRIHSAYRLVLDRLPTEAEAERVRAFLTEYETAYRGLPAVTAKPARPAKPKAPAAVPANPDEVDQTGEATVEEVIRPKDARAAAWMAFVQALFGSAEFRYLR